MKTNQEAIILAERAADYGRLRSVLHEWGYGESEIQRFLSEPRIDQKLDQQSETTDQSNKVLNGVAYQHYNSVAPVGPTTAGDH